MERPIREYGRIIGKRYVEAKEKRTDMNGKEWPATDEKFLIQAVSCDEEDFDEINGMQNATILEYPTDKLTWDNAVFLEKVKVKYCLNQFAEKITYKPKSIELIDEK